MPATFYSKQVFSAVVFLIVLSLSWQEVWQCIEAAPQPKDLGNKRTRSKKSGKGSHHPHKSQSPFVRVHCWKT